MKKREREPGEIEQDRRKEYDMMIQNPPKHLTYSATHNPDGSLNNIGRKYMFEQKLREHKHGKP